MSPPLPDGKYIVHYLGDREVGERVAADFQVAVGEFAGARIQMLICSRKAAEATRLRSGRWLEWMAYEGDAKASSVLDASLNAVAGYMLADVRDGQVHRAKSPTTSETTFNKFLKQLSPLWAIHTSADSQARNLVACQTYRRILDLLPRLWGTSPGERDLRLWLNNATDPSSSCYYHPASVWLNAIYEELGGTYQCPAARSWPLRLKNNGFDRPPKRPLGTASEVEPRVQL